MIKLKEVITQLEENNYLEIEKNFIKNKADRFLLLFQSYKNTASSDKEIRSKLGVNANSFYVLKSRLYDKIQESLSCDMFIDQEKTVKLLLKVPEVCLTSPRETAIAYLEKLEKELSRFDMHNELLVVYSALKKMHLYSEKYYHYSQLYNKQVSFGLSLEKAEDVLGNFCNLLGQYDLSKSEELYEKLLFLKNEIINIYTLSSSRQIELIKNLIELQLAIFCNNDKASKVNVTDLLQKTRIIFDDLPATIVHKKWELVLDYLCFEYYYSIDNIQTAMLYYQTVNAQFSNLFLYNHICLTSRFLISKITFCLDHNRANDLILVSKDDAILYDPKDQHAHILLGLYNAMVYFNQAKYKDAALLLTDIQTDFIFKNFPHQYLNIKLTLAYFYIIMGEFEKALANLKIVNKLISKKRKIQSDDNDPIFYLMKVFDLLINKDQNSKNKFKQRDYFILFMANNKKKDELIRHLIPVFKKKYQI